MCGKWLLVHSIFVAETAIRALLSTCIVPTGISTRLPPLATAPLRSSLHEIKSIANMLPWLFATIPFYWGSPFRRNRVPCVWKSDALIVSVLLLSMFSRSCVYALLKGLSSGINGKVSEVLKVVSSELLFKLLKKNHHLFPHILFESIQSRGCLMSWRQQLRESGRQTWQDQRPRGCSKERQ